MAKTTNYEFNKPGEDDYYSIDDQNDNWDTADDVLKEHEDAIEKLTSFLEETLTAGQTSITISDPSITTSGMFEYYTTIYGANPKSITVVNGSITLTFKAQAQNMGVKVGVR